MTGQSGSAFRPTHVVVDLDAIRSNVVALRQLVGPTAVWAVVKADGYGHGAIRVASAALEAGAAGCAVALVEEGLALRDAGITGPVLVLSQAPEPALAAAVAAGFELTAYSAAHIDAIGRASDAADREVGSEVGVHLKVDTGMHRVGASPTDAAGLARRIVNTRGVRLSALWTHLAVADEPARHETDEQIDRFEAVEERCRAAGTQIPGTHLANSAGALAHPRARRDLVRCGIAVYGLDPGPSVSGVVELRPAMSVRSEVSWVHRAAAGSGISYGHHRVVDRDTTVATVPIGYADGVARRLGLEGGVVLIGGTRRPILGVVTMDQLMVDCGDDPIGPGDEVVLIGEQGDERITADEWASRLDTINYEIVCGFGERVPRVYVG